MRSQKTHKPPTLTRRPAGRKPYPVKNAAGPKHDTPVWHDPATNAVFCPCCSTAALAGKRGVA
jgi:hypothetical protein